MCDAAGSDGALWDVGRDSGRAEQLSGIHDWERALFIMPRERSPMPRRATPKMRERNRRSFSKKSKLVPKEEVFSNNTEEALLALAARMVEGEILVRENKLDAGIAELREAIKLEDALNYDEPPGWLIPVRHSLGATLMQNGRYAEAEQVYREDLERLPENGWSLYGLASSLKAQKKNAE